jgi:hypothetical protein
MRNGTLNMVMNNMDPGKATKILAKTLYKELKNSGFSHKHIVEFSRELLEHLSQDVKTEQTSKIALQQERILAS